MCTIAERLSRKRSAQLREKSTQQQEADPLEEGEAAKEKTAKRDNSRCTSSFFSISCEELAKKLLGCILVVSNSREEDDSSSSNSYCKGRIIETEAYLGTQDKAAHSFNGRRTARNEAMYMPPGTCYVYTIYGIHHCVNISSQGEGAAVLIRALEPLEGVQRMRERRKKCAKDIDLCQGPAKLCQALGISKRHNMLDVGVSMEIWVESDGTEPEEVVSCPRVGVDYAEEWTSKPLRYYIKGNRCVSKIIRE